MMRKIVDNYSGRTMMLNGEDYDTLAILENRSIANYRRLLDGIALLAIDEAQNITQIGSILKLIVDEIPGISEMCIRDRQYGWDIYLSPFLSDVWHIIASMNGRR